MRTLRLEEAVEFAGFIEDVPARIAQLEIVVHASTTGEPFGQVIIEAMAEGKPVVGTNGGGVPEIVEDGVTGMLVPMGDAARMTEALTYLWEIPGRRRRWGAMEGLLRRRSSPSKGRRAWLRQCTAKYFECLSRRRVILPRQIRSGVWR
jgi:glycosyltransferase involved in cell wall biosynthesis